MWYEFGITIPAGTIESDPVDQVLELAYGVIDRMIIEAAPGCKRYAAIRILHWEHQVVPANPSGDIALNATAREFDCRIELFEPPYNLRVIGYAPSADYDHEYRIGLSLVDPKILPEYSESPGALQKILKVMGLS